MEKFEELKTVIQSELNDIVVFKGQLGTIAPENATLARKLYDLKNRLAKVIHGQDLLDMYNQGATIELRKRGVCTSRHILLDGRSHTSSLKNCDDFEAILAAIAFLVEDEDDEDDDDEDDEDDDRPQSLMEDLEEYPENVDFHNDLLDEIYD
jgi:hypothetical protein